MTTQNGIDVAQVAIANQDIQVVRHSRHAEPKMRQGRAFEDNGRDGGLRYPAQQFPKIIQQCQVARNGLIVLRTEPGHHTLRNRHGGAT